MYNGPPFSGVSFYAYLQLFFNIMEGGKRHQSSASGAAMSKYDVEVEASTETNLRLTSIKEGLKNHSYTSGGDETLKAG